VNINVGSLRGTNGEDDTISWPFSAKKFRKVDLISLTPLMFIQSRSGPAKIIRTRPSEPEIKGDICGQKRF
jgi:hypothetical protein